MSVALLDTNVLIALAWPSHVHHLLAHKWFRKNGGRGWATCPITESSFIRISSNPGIIPEAVTPKQAMEQLVRMTSKKGHVFWPCDLPFRPNEIPFEGVVGHRQVTDAYLLGLATHRKGKLVTFDKAIPSLIRPEDPQRNSIEVIGLSS